MKLNLETMLFLYKKRLIKVTNVTITTIAAIVKKAAFSDMTPVCLSDQNSCKRSYNQYIKIIYSDLLYLLSHFSHAKIDNICFFDTIMVFYSKIR